MRLGPRSLAALAACVVSALCAAPASAGSWSRPAFLRHRVYGATTQIALAGSDRVAALAMSAPPTAFSGASLAVADVGSTPFGVGGDVLGAALGGDGSGGVLGIAERGDDPTGVVAIERAADGTWSASAPLADLGASGGPVAVALTPGGDAVAAWIGGGSLHVSFRPAGGAWSTPVSTPAPIEIDGVAVGMRSAGHALLAWWEAGELDVAAAAPGGVGPSHRLSSAPVRFDVAAPSLTADASGGGTVAWREDTGSGYLPFAVRVAADGTPGPPHELGTETGYGLRVAGDAAGDAIAVWNTSSGALLSSTYAGGAWSAPRLVSHDARAFGVDVAADGRGMLVAALGSTLRLIAQPFTIGGAAAAPQVVACGALEVDQVVAGEDGAAAVLVDNGSDVETARFDPAGTGSEIGCPAPPPAPPAREPATPWHPPVDGSEGPGDLREIGPRLAFLGRPRIDSRGRIAVVAAPPGPEPMPVSGTVELAGGRRVRLHEAVVTAPDAQPRIVRLRARGGRFRAGPVGATLTAWGTTVEATRVAAAAGIRRGGGGHLVGGNRNDVLTGGAGRDVLAGWRGDDILTGGLGNDRLAGEPGSDTLRGGPGDDVLDGAENADVLDGGSGDDRLDGGGDRDVLFGGAGDDVLGGGSHADIVEGGPGDDNLDGGFGADGLYGGVGSDVLQGGADDDRLDGGPGSDLLIGGTGADDMVGGDGDDQIVAGVGYDHVDAGAGNDTIYGGGGRYWCGPGQDTVVMPPGSTAEMHSCEHVVPSSAPWVGNGSHYVVRTPRAGGRTVGTDGNDTIDGDAGPDEILGGNGDDVIWSDAFPGDAAPDRVDGGPGDDTIYGGAGDDALVGGPGDDYLEGNSGADRLDGGPGDDEIRGDQGNDRIVAGAGDDLIRVVGGGRDVVDCGPGRDTVEADRSDVLRGCERVRR